MDDLDLTRTPLLDLRKSEKRRLALMLKNGGRADEVCFWQNIANTLSQFTMLLPENEEQLYFFGAAMRDIVDRAGLPENVQLPDHSNREVKMAFTGGFLRFPITETLGAVHSHRATEGARSLRSRERLSSKTSSDYTLVQEVRAVAPLVPSEKPS